MDDVANQQETHPEVVCCSFQCPLPPFLTTTELRVQSTRNYHTSSQGFLFVLLVYWVFPELAESAHEQSHNCHNSGQPQ